MIFERSSKFEPDINIIVSSANRENLTEEETSGKSLINRRNNKGPRMDPCVTPHYISLVAEN